MQRRDFVRLLHMQFSDFLGEWSMVAIKNRADKINVAPEFFLFLTLIFRKNVINESYLIINLRPVSVAHSSIVRSL